MPYTFEWGVKDDVTLNDYAQQAASDGNVATGTYRVLLPDGRVQTVAYKADAVNGYIADVTYNWSFTTIFGADYNHDAILYACFIFDIMPIIIKRIINILLFI